MPRFQTDARSKRALQRPRPLPCHQLNRFHGHAVKPPYHRKPVEGRGMLACVRHIDRSSSKRGSGKTERDVSSDAQRLFRSRGRAGSTITPQGRASAIFLRRGLSLPRTLPYRPRPPHPSPSPARPSGSAVSSDRTETLIESRGARCVFGAAASTEVLRAVAERPAFQHTF